VTDRLQFGLGRGGGVASDRTLVVSVGGGAVDANRSIHGFGSLWDTLTNGFITSPSECSRSVTPSRKRSIGQRFALVLTRGWETSRD